MMDALKLQSAGVSPAHAEATQQLAAAGVPAETILGWVIAHGPTILTTLAELLSFVGKAPSPPAPTS